MEVGGAGAVEVGDSEAENPGQQVADITHCEVWAN